MGSPAEQSVERQAGRVQCTPSPLSALWITEKPLNQCPLMKLQWEYVTDAHKCKRLLYMTSFEVEHINLSVRELYYTTDFSAEIHFKRSSFSFSGFQRHRNLDENSFTLARKLISATMDVGPIPE